MQKWEYLFLKAEIAHEDWRARYVNGEEIKNWQAGITLYDFANRLGEEGWELITAPYGYTYSEPHNTLYETYRLVFKRPLPAPPRGPLPASLHRGKLTRNPTDT